MFVCDVRLWRSSVTAITLTLSSALQKWLLVSVLLSNGAAYMAYKTFLLKPLRGV